MELVGDAEGIAALQELKLHRREYLRFLLQEAQTVFERRVDFQNQAGRTFRLSFVPHERKLVVSRLS